MNIKLTLNKPLIIEAVKNETFHRGQIDKATATTTAASAAGIPLAYHEQAGDETYHERIIERSLYSNLADFKSRLSDYLTASGQSSADNIVQTTEGDNIILILSVSDRFNTSLTDALAKLASEYIVNATLTDWWRPINDKQSAFYAQVLERNVAAIHRCFNKTAPIVPPTPYTTTLSTTGSAIDIAVAEDYTVTYTIDEGAIDDIEARVEDKRICAIGRADDGFTVRGLRRGHTYITLFSRHDDTITTTVHVYVTDHS